MTSANRPNQPRQQNHSQSRQNSSRNRQEPSNIDQEIIQTINELNDGFKDYNIRIMVKHSAKFGESLKNGGLQTNQIRKFLDAINRLKATLNQENINFENIEPEIVLLQPKLAYAAARQKAAKPLSNVISKAIDKVKNVEDFQRLVQFIESVVAYHKAAGGQ